MEKYCAGVDEHQKGSAIRGLVVLSFDLAIGQYIVFSRPPQRRSPNFEEEQQKKRIFMGERDLSVVFKTPVCVAQAERTYSRREEIRHPGVLLTISPTVLAKYYQRTCSNVVFDGSRLVWRRERANGLATARDCFDGGGGIKPVHSPWLVVHYSVDRKSRGSYVKRVY